MTLLAKYDFYFSINDRKILLFEQINLPHIVQS